MLLPARRFPQPAKLDPVRRSSVRPPPDLDWITRKTPPENSPVWVAPLALRAVVSLRVPRRVSNTAPTGIWLNSSRRTNAPPGRRTNTSPRTGSTSTALPSTGGETDGPGPARARTRTRAGRCKGHAQVVRVAVVGGPREPRQRQAGQDRPGAGGNASVRAPEQHVGEVARGPPRSPGRSRGRRGVAEIGTARAQEEDLHDSVVLLAREAAEVSGQRGGDLARVYLERGPGHVRDLFAGVHRAGIAASREEVAAATDIGALGEARVQPVPYLTAVKVPSRGRSSSRRCFRRSLRRWIRRRPRPPHSLTRIPLGRTGSPRGRPPRPAPREREQQESQDDRGGKEARDQYQGSRPVSPADVVPMQCLGNGRGRGRPAGRGGARDRRERGHAAALGARGQAAHLARRARTAGGCRGAEIERLSGRPSATGPATRCRRATASRASCARWRWTA